MSPDAIASGLMQQKDAADSGYNGLCSAAAVVLLLGCHLDQLLLQLVLLTTQLAVSSLLPPL